MTSRKLLSIHIASALGLSLAASAVQAADEATNKDDDVERVEVVGSHIKRADIEGASPVLTISRDTIDKSGYNNLQQILEKLPATGSGTFSTQGNNQDSTANGAAGVSLRGLGADATLVLINGRRTSISSFAQNITTNFVDINSIPVSAIERIEILKDGASASYGSDAIAGVVNVVLRKDFQGTEVNVGYGNTTDSDNHENTASLVWGFGDDKSNGTLILDYFSNSALMNKDRGYLGTANQEPRGGFDQRSSRSFPGLFQLADGTTEVDATCPPERNVGICVFDYGPYNYLIPRAERQGLMFLGHRELSSNVEAFTELGMQHNTSEAQGAPTPIDESAGLTVSASNPNNPYGQDLDILRFRPVDTGPRRWDIETTNMRALFGLKGSINDWDWEVSAEKARSESTQTGTQGWVRGDKLQAAIDSGLYNPFGSTYNSPEALAAIATHLERKGISHLTAADASVSGPLMEMSYGTLSMAAGVESRKEDAQDIPDQQFTDGLIPGTEAVSASASRKQRSAYVEFIVPLYEHLELQLAERYDHYDDFGSTTNPKVAVRWQPVDMLTLRTSWGTGFRAPSLAQVGLGPSQSSAFFVDNYRCAQNPSACQSLDYVTQFAGNPDLDPEKSESFNIGGIVQLTDNLNFSLDWWSIRQTDKIDQVPFDRVYDANCNDQNSTICVRGTPGVGETLGPILRVNNTFFNVGSVKTQGIDFTANYNMDMGSYGSMRFNLDGTYLDKLERRLFPGEQTQRLDGEYNYPQWRWAASADWTNGDWGANVGVFYIGEFEDFADPEGTGTNQLDLKGRTVDSMTTVNMQLRYTGFDNTVLTLGLDNAFDEDPPFVIGDENDDLYGYNSHVHNPRGRFVYAKASYRF